MGDNDKLVELAEEVGGQVQCIKVIKTRLDALEKRPNLPGWLCKWAGVITPSVIIAAAVAVTGVMFRLSAVEKTVAARQDRLLRNIARELAVGEVETPEPVAARPARTHHSAPTIAAPTPIPMPEPVVATGKDSTKAEQVYRRLKAGS